MLRFKAVNTVITVASGARQQSDTSITATRIENTAAERATTTKPARKVSRLEQFSAIFTVADCIVYVKSPRTASLF